MRHRLTALVAVVLLALLAGAGPALPAAGADEPPGTLHRVVWDQFERRGTHLWSANPDGTDARRIYVRPRGAPYQLVLNPRGTEVATAPLVLSAERAALVRVDVLGEGGHQNLIADHPEIYFVGAIGWSPGGGRLAFEGGVEVRPRVLRTFLFTVRRDGTGLRRLASLGSPLENTSIAGHLAWTPAGVFYADGHGIRLFRHGRSRPVLPGGVELAISGDGDHLYARRISRGSRSSLWTFGPDGRGAQKLWSWPVPGDGPFPTSFQPSYDGSRMLTWLDDGRVVVHDPTRAPRASDPVLPFRRLGAVTWN